MESAEPQFYSKNNQKEIRLQKSAGKHPGYVYPNAKQKLMQIKKILDFENSILLI